MVYGRLRESQIENKVCRYAREKGFDAFKQTWPGTHGAPDRLMITRKGFIFMIEFKRGGGKLTDHQARRIDRLRAKGVHVHVVDSVELGKTVVDMYADS